MLASFALVVALIVLTETPAPSPALPPKASAPATEMRSPSRRDVTVRLVPSRCAPMTNAFVTPLSCV